MDTDNDNESVSSEAVNSCPSFSGKEENGFVNEQEEMETAMESERINQLWVKQLSAGIARPAEEILRWREMRPRIEVLENSEGTNDAQSSDEMNSESDLIENPKRNARTSFSAEFEDLPTLCRGHSAVMAKIAKMFQQISAIQDDNQRELTNLKAEVARLQFNAMTNEQSNSQNEENHGIGGWNDSASIGSPSPPILTRESPKATSSDGCSNYGSVNNAERKMPTIKKRPQKIKSAKKKLPQKMASSAAKTKSRPQGTKENAKKSTYLRICLVDQEKKFVDRRKWHQHRLRCAPCQKEHLKTMSSLKKSRGHWICVVDQNLKFGKAQQWWRHRRRCVACESRVKSTNTSTDQDNSAGEMEFKSTDAQSNGESSVEMGASDSRSSGRHDYC